MKENLDIEPLLSPRPDQDSDVAFPCQLISLQTCAEVVNSFCNGLPADALETIFHNMRKRFRLRSDVIPLGSVSEAELRVLDRGISAVGEFGGSQVRLAGPLLTLIGVCGAFMQFQCCPEEPLDSTRQGCDPKSSLTPTTRSV